jgi:ankyrin repeat protein
LHELGGDIHAHSSDGATPICIAACQGHCQTISLLVSLGVNVNHVSENGTTPLCVATRGGYFKAIRLLCELGADVNIPNSTGTTPLCIAACQGQSEIVEYLCSRGALVNQSAFTASSASSFASGITPICIASQEGHHEVIRILHRYGADLHVMASNGTTPLWIAAQEGRNEVIRVFAELMNGSTSRSGDGEGSRHAVDFFSNEATTIGTTSVWIAACQGFSQTIHLLHSYGCNVNQSNTTNGTTPTCVAAQAGHVSAILVLQECHADIDHATDSGITPVCVAAGVGQRLTQELLIQMGCSIELLLSSTDSPSLDPCREYLSAIFRRYESLRPPVTSFWRCSLLSIIKLSLFPLRKALYLLIATVEAERRGGGGGGGGGGTNSRKYHPMYQTQDPVAKFLLSFAKSSMDLVRFELLLVKLEILFFRHYLSEPSHLSSILRLFAFKYSDRKYILNTLCYQYWNILPALCTAYSSILLTPLSLSPSSTQATSLSVNFEQIKFLEISSSESSSLSSASASSSSVDSLPFMSHQIEQQQSKEQQLVELTPYDHKILFPLVDQYTSLIVLFTDPGLLGDVFSFRLICRDTFYEMRFPLKRGRAERGDGDRDRDRDEGVVLSEKGLIESYLGGSMSAHIPTLNLLRYFRHLKLTILPRARY